MSQSFNPVRKTRITIRFTDHEMAVIRTVAGEEGVDSSEAIRRLIFWKRPPEYSARLAALLDQWLTMGR
jgi:hypothetical protein